MTKSIMKISQEVISSNEQLHRFVEEVKAVTIPLFPDTLNFVRPEFKLSATVVSVVTKVDKYGNNRDIYKTENGQYALHLSKLNEIAKAAGLQITDSRILERKIDEQGRVIYVLFQVKGYVKSIDGSIKEDVSTGKYDYHRDVEKYSSQKQVKGRRGHAEALAESNAKTRLFNKLVTKLAQSFSLEELKKPFLVPCVIEDKNELLKDLDPETQKQIKAEYARKQLGLVNQIYGHKEIEEVSYTTEPEDNDEEEDPGLSEEEKNHIIAEEFRQSSPEERAKVILALIDEKGHEHPKGLKYTEKMILSASEDRQIQFIEKLLNMEAKL